MKINFTQKIEERIDNFNNGKVFISIDFLDIADYETVRKILNRLTDSKKIQKIIKGVYYNPSYNELIEEYEAPSVHEVAKAIARKYNWTIAPSGNTALNLLGLSTQVPSKWTYISDGRYADFSFGNTVIEFKHRNNKEISNISIETASVIQALKTIGKDKVTEEDIEILKNRLTEEQKERLIEEGKVASAWVYKIIRKII